MCVGVLSVLLCCSLLYVRSSFSSRLECDEVCDMEERNRLERLLVVNLCVRVCMCATAFYSEPMLH